MYLYRETRISASSQSWRMAGLEKNPLLKEISYQYIHSKCHNGRLVPFTWIEMIVSFPEKEPVELRVEPFPSSLHIRTWCIYIYVTLLFLHLLSMYQHSGFNPEGVHLRFIPCSTVMAFSSRQLESRHTRQSLSVVAAAGQTDSIVYSMYIRQILIWKVGRQRPAIYSRSCEHTVYIVDE